MPANLLDLARALRSGDMSLEDSLAQLEGDFNEREPRVRAFLPEEGRFDRLRREAEELAKRFPDAASRPPLFGVPIGVKDIFHVDGFTTRGGSKLPPELFQGFEAASVTQLKAAGALILGKTVTTEFAYFAPGPTRNPRNPDHTPGGSSSGSAAAVGAGLCPLALGTQTIGSIVRPASFCGVVGFKPTFGRIATAGVIPFAASFDQIGFFTTDVASTRLAASVLCQSWRTDAAAARRPVLGVPTGPYLERASVEMRAHFQKIAARLADAGFEIKNGSVMPDFDAIYARHFLVTNGEAARVHAGWFSQYRARYHFKTAEQLALGGATTDAALAQARSECQAFADTLTRLTRQHGVDLWISPAAVGPAPAGLDATGDPVMNLPWSQAGFPAINLPSGVDAHNLPLGLQLTAVRGDDERLLTWAGELEAALAGAGS